MRNIGRVGAVVSLLLAAGGCDAVIGDPAGRGSEAGDGPLGGGGAELDCSAPTAGEAPTRRLGRREYRNTVRDLLRLEGVPELSLPPDDVQGGFYSNSRDVVSMLHVERYGSAARALAQEAVARLDALLPCAPSGPLDEACARGFIETFGARAYRRPLDASEVEGLLALFRAGTGEDGAYGFDTGARLVIEAILQSPFFLYRFESGAAGEAGEPVPLSGYEVASRLSYFLWASMPDDALFAAAADGSLSDAAGVRAQAERMIDDPRAHDGILAFFGQWLLLEGVGSVEKSDAFPLWAGAAESAEDEAMRFVSHVVEDGDATLASLLTSRSAWVDAASAPLYGIEPPAEGTAEVELDPSRRAGILTRVGVLASASKVDRTSPILRGLFVRRQLLCYEPGPPPEGVDTNVPEVEGKTLRERLAAHQSSPACRGCHAMIDPVGFAFEHYDAAGVWRDVEAGVDVDASGNLVGTDVDGPLDGAVELSERLARSRTASDCATLQMLRFALGRALSDEDACVARELSERFAASGGDFRQLFVDIAASRALRTMPADPTRARREP